MCPCGAHLLQVTDAVICNRQHMVVQKKWTEKKTMIFLRQMENKPENTVERQQQMENRVVFGFSRGI